MMATRQDLLDAMAGLYEYPQGDFPERLMHCRTLAEQRSAGRGEMLASLLERTRDMERGAVEEMFTRTFEINPVCALEVGWHVYGEEYARGALMVRLRQELRQHGIAEITELPDHLTHVLQLLGRLDKELADDLAGRYLLPAVEKMIEAVDGKDCPYQELLEMTRDVVGDEFDAVVVAPMTRRTEPPGIEPQPRLPVFQPSASGLCGTGPAACGVPSEGPLGNHSPTRGAAIHGDKARF